MKSLIKKSKPIISLANEIVPITQVLELAGVSVPTHYRGKSMRTGCPYAQAYHWTADADRSMRVYPDTNTANCFRGCGLLTPVSIYATLHDISSKEAAWQLLLMVGHRPQTLEEKWLEAGSYEEPVPLEIYRDCLTEFCIRLCGADWVRIQYDKSVSRTFAALLETLSACQSPADAECWLETAKETMRVELTNGI